MRIIHLATAAIVAVSLSASTSAIAGPDATAATEPEKSPTTSVIVSVGGTLAGWGVLASSGWYHDVSLFVAGESLAALGPSGGHFYAGEYRHALIMSGLRAAAYGLTDFGAIRAGGHLWGSQSDVPQWTFYTGAAAVIGLTIYDWIDAPAAADRVNRRALSFAFAPLIVPGDHHVTGLAVTGQF